MPDVLVGATGASLKIKARLSILCSMSRQKVSIAAKMPNTASNITTTRVPKSRACEREGTL